MSYVVRLGYPDTADGYPQYGIEAVLSPDHGKTWDLDHRYLLVTYRGTRAKKANAWWDAATQGTSSLTMPDGSILTAFGSGHRVNPARARNRGLFSSGYRACPMETEPEACQWGRFDLASRIRFAQLRNVFDPQSPNFGLK